MAPLVMSFAQLAIAYLLLVLGVYGITFACLNPRPIWPGALGAAALLVALVALQNLAASYVALALIGIGAALLVGELHVPFAGVLGASGLLAFVVGSATLIDSASAPARVLLAVTAVLAAAGQLRVVRLAMRRAHPPAAAASRPRDM
jgi:membrane-bound serine protease (ClpP class)